MEKINRINKFFSEEDFRFDLEVGREYMGDDINSKVILHRVDKVRSKMDELYGESLASEMQFLPPVELKVIFKIDASEPKAYNPNGTLRFTDYGQLTFSVYDQELKDKGVDISYGDYIEIRDNETSKKYFEVSDDGRINIDNQHTIGGYKSFYRTVKCIHTQIKDI